MVRLILLLVPTLLLSFASTASAQDLSAWNGSWVGFWNGGMAEVQVAGRTVRASYKSPLQPALNLQATGDTLSFSTPSGSAVMMRRTGQDSAQVTLQRGSAIVGPTTLTRSTARVGGGSSWDGTWWVELDRAWNPVQIVVSGNQMVSYFFGKRADETPRPTASVASTKIAGNALKSRIESGQGFAHVTLTRTGPSTAQYEFSADGPGIRVTGTAYRRSPECRGG
jgi:hypothetical protein